MAKFFWCQQEELFGEKKGSKCGKATKDGEKLCSDHKAIKMIWPQDDPEPEEKVNESGN